MIKICAKCGKPFSTPSSRGKYCSICGPKVVYYVKKPILTKRCENPACKKSFKTSNSLAKFCCDRCRAEAHSEKAFFQKKCEYCGTVFITSTDKRKYCSPEHAYSHKLAHERSRADARKTESI